MHLLDLKGQTFGRLTVVARAVSRPGHAYWTCRCKCGTEKVYLGKNLRRGITTSCGCLRTEQLVERSTTHGKTRTRSYSVWAGMLQRCTNPAMDNYAFYGGRGIRVCASWYVFENFLKDMDEPPTDHTLERRNVNQHYSPTNCCWIHKSKQNENKRNSHCFTISGVTKCLSAWQREFGVLPSTYKSRLKRGWTSLNALKTPVKK